MPPRRPKTRPRRPKMHQESENEANMEPSWHENPAQINTYADNLENFKNIGKPLKNQRKLTRVGERSERASAASEASGAFRRFGEALRSKTVPKGFLRETKETRGKHKSKRRFPFHVKSGLCWGWFWEPRRLQKSEKTIGFIRFSAIFRDLC